MKQQQELILGLLGGLLFSEKETERKWISGRGEVRGSWEGWRKGKLRSSQVYCMREYIFNKNFKKLKKLKEIF